MPEAYLVMHSRPRFDGVSKKLVGVYESQSAAAAAVARASRLPGFRETPTGFAITEATLDFDLQRRQQLQGSAYLPPRVFVVSHEWELRLSDDEWRDISTLVGVFSTKENADAVVAAIADRFTEPPIDSGIPVTASGEFFVGELEVGEDDWTEGFVGEAAAVDD